MIELPAVHFIKLVSTCVSENYCIKCPFRSDCSRTTKKAYDEARTRIMMGQ